MELLDTVGYSSGVDTLVLLGDYVDRGPDSAKVVQWIRRATKSFGQVLALMGNHDDRYVRYHQHMLKKRKHSNYTIPFQLPVEKLQVYNSLSDEDLEFLSLLEPIYHHHFPTSNPNLQQWSAVHAGIQLNKSLWSQDKDKVIHIRYLDKTTHKIVPIGKDFQPPPNSIYWTELASVYRVESNVVYGHNIHSLTTPRNFKTDCGRHFVGIDTGCCYGGRLTAFVLNSGQETVDESCFYQVQARQAYSKNLVIVK